MALALRRGIGVGQPVAQGAALASFSIAIDATALFYRQFIVIGSDTSFVDSRQVRSF